MTRQPPPARRNGFTLLELLVVLAIAGLMTALVPAMISAAVPGARLKSHALELAATLREARNTAVSRGVTVDVIVESEAEETRTPRYTVTGGASEELPENIALNVAYTTPALTSQSIRQSTSQSTSQENHRLDGQFNLRFYPDGSATGGSIELRQDRWAYRIEINWLIGSIAVTAGTVDAR